MVRHQSNHFNEPVDTGNIDNINDISDNSISTCSRICVEGDYPEPPFYVREINLIPPADMHFTREFQRGRMVIWQ